MLYSIHFIGITINELIYELRQGIRLADHEYCPTEICHLIHTCFLENPSQRPTFNKIKQNIQHAYDIIQGNRVCESKSETPSASIVPLEILKSNAMKEGYMKVQMANKINSELPNKDDTRASITYTEIDFDIKCTAGNTIEGSEKLLNNLAEKYSDDVSQFKDELTDDKNVNVDCKGYTPMAPRTHAEIV